MMPISAQKILRDRNQRSQLVLFRLTKEREVTRSSLLLELFPVLDSVRHATKRFDSVNKRLSPDAAIELKFKFSNHIISRWKDVFTNFTPEVEIDEDDLIQSANYRASSFVNLLEDLLAEEGGIKLFDDVNSLRELRPLAFVNTAGKPNRFSPANHLSREIMMISTKLMDIASTTLEEISDCDPNRKSMFSLSVEMNPVIGDSGNEYFNSFDFMYITFDPQFDNWLKRCTVSRRNYTVEHNHGESKSKYTTTSNLQIHKEGTYFICGSNHKPTKFSVKRDSVASEGQKPFKEIIKRGNFYSTEDNSFCLDYEMFKESHSIGELVNYEELGSARILIRKSCKLLFLEVEEQCNIHNLPVCEYTDYMYDTQYVRALATVSLIERTLERIKPFMDDLLVKELLIKVAKLRDFALSETL